MDARYRESLMGKVEAYVEDSTLYTIIRVNKGTKRETVLYGCVTYNVVCEYLGAYVDDEHDVRVQRYVKESGYRCDYSMCEGTHPTKWNYCTLARRDEVDRLTY